MTTLTWEREVEVAFDLLATTDDEDAFRVDMERLGFDRREIDEWLNTKEDKP